MKSFVVGLLVLAAALLFTASGHAFKEGGENCLKCHSLSEKEMTGILEKLDMPGAKVLSIGMGPVKGLWEVAVENKGRRMIIYVDFAKKLVSPGPFIDYAMRKDITGERIEALNKDRKVDTRGLSLNDALVIGKAEAPVRVIVFTDPACKYCARLHGQMKAVAAKRPDIVFYLKLFTMISRDPKVAKSIICSKSLAMLENAYEKKPVEGHDCATNEIDDNMKFVEEHGIDAAPALIFPDGTLQLGYSTADSLEKRIDEAVANRNREKEPKGEAAK